MYPVVHGSLVVGGIPKGAKRAELSAEQRSEIARLIAEIDSVQKETASAAEQSRIELEEERRLDLSPSLN